VLLACMVPKYAGPHDGTPVMVMGWIHGGLFIAYVIIFSRASWALHWSWRATSLSLLASLLPVAPYFVAHRIHPRTGTQPQRSYATEEST
jgi:integral membrane protein